MNRRKPQPILPAVAIETIKDASRLFMEACSMMFIVSCILIIFFL